MHRPCQARVSVAERRVGRGMARSCAAVVLRHSRAHACHLRCLSQNNDIILVSLVWAATNSTQQHATAIDGDMAARGACFSFKECCDER